MEKWSDREMGERGNTSIFNFGICGNQEILLRIDKTWMGLHTTFAGKKELTNKHIIVIINAVTQEQIFST